MTTSRALARSYAEFSQPVDLGRLESADQILDRALGADRRVLVDLDASIMYKIDRYGSSFWAAVNASEGERALSPLERRRAKLWLERAEALLQQVEEPQAFESRGSTADHGAAAHAEQAAFVSDPSVN